MMESNELACAKLGTNKKARITTLCVVFVLLASLVAPFANATTFYSPTENIVTVGKNVYFSYFQEDIHFYGLQTTPLKLTYSSVLSSNGTEVVTESPIEGTIRSLVYVDSMEQPWGTLEVQGGLEFVWNLGSYTMDMVKDYPVKVTIYPHYLLRAEGIEGYGQAEAGFKIVGYSDQWIDFASFNKNQTSNLKQSFVDDQTGNYLFTEEKREPFGGLPYIRRYSEGTTEITFQTTVGQLEQSGRKIAVLCYAKADGGSGFPQSSGIPYFNAAATITFESIGIEFLSEPTESVSPTATPDLTEPSPTVPEFPSLALLPFLMVAAIAGTVLIKKLVLFRQAE
jgi:hypothetical protein